jgi:hypothetical protein
MGLGPLESLTVLWLRLSQRMGREIAFGLLRR